MENKIDEVSAKVQKSSPRKERNFGLLRIPQGKRRQAQSRVHYDQVDLSSFARIDNERLIKIVKGSDKKQIRKLSRWFAQVNGIYARAVRYIADLYRFDYLTYPNLQVDAEPTETESKKILKKFNEVLEFFDGSELQLMCRKWAEAVCLDGVYYGYICEDVNDKLVIQDLPTDYCRSRFYVKGMPLIEFNTEYFDDLTRDEAIRKRFLDLFPKEIQVGYRKKVKEKDRWILLDEKRAFKFKFNESELPPFLSAIPRLLQLGEVQDLEKEKLLQDLQKILVQEFDVDKNGQIPFTVKEMSQINQNAVDMVGDAVGINVLTTVADVHLEDMAPKNGRTSEDSVDSAENNVYNDLGISSNLFNTDGNLALEKSILTDQAFVKPLLLQFQRLFNSFIEWKFNKKKLAFRMKMLDTTIFNHKEMAKDYQNLTKIGFSRFLPMIALGHTQKEVISLARLEQQMMELDNWMLPPFSSNTMSSDTWQDIKNIQKGGSMQPNGQPAPGGKAPAAKKPGEVGTKDKGGRPELSNDKKTEKTIQNKESQG